MKKILLTILSSLSLNQLHAATSLKMNEITYKQKFKLINEYFQNNPEVLAEIIPQVEFNDENEQPTPDEVQAAALLLLRMSIKEYTFQLKNINQIRDRVKGKNGTTEKGGGNESRG